MYYAHSVEGADYARWQPLPVHLIGVAELAAAFGKPLGIERAARLAGLLHDLGKYSPAFLKRLAGGRERVDHSTAGAVIVRELAEAGTPDDRIIAELIAYGIAGHHAGLPDKQGEAFSTLAQRMADFDRSDLDEIWRSQIAPDIAGLVPDFRWSDGRAFQLAFLGRMIFSCLVDADFKDTEAFYAQTEGRTIERQWPGLPTILPQLLARFSEHMAKVSRADSPVNILRGNILRHVLEKAGEKPGLFTLTVPTGGGKTLASLGFALNHAQAHGAGRIIYAIPFTSIIDQTAAIFRAVLGEEYVLEHHSAIDEEKPDRDRSGKDKLKLAMEDWAAPIVVTTNVQLFESLFAARGARARKLHNIANSVIILDEAQTLTRPLLIPAIAALRELAENYGCTIVLCTATQPALDQSRFPEGLALKGRELAPDPEALARALKRVTLHHAGPMNDAALVEALRGHSQGLVIVNSRKHALSLYRAAQESGLEGLIHLTTRQYAAHRRDILDKVRQRLKADTPCRVIATSLVEAGVDLDFPRVWRAEAGLDQIAQASGRCNREGKRPVAESIVTVFSAPDNPPPPEIGGLMGDMKRMMDSYADLFSPAAMEHFFCEVFWRLGPKGLDAKDILADFRLGSGGTNFAYRTVAKKFRMIESGMVPVIVAADGKAQEAIENLKLERILSGAIARLLQPYTVQVPPRARARLIAGGHVAFASEALRGDQFAVLMTPSLYGPEVGLVWEDADYLGLEQFMI